MRTIWKYELRITSDEQVIEVPRGARVLHVGCGIDIERFNVFVWIRLNDDLPVTHRVLLYIVGTGREVGDSGVDEFRYVSSFWRGDDMMHVFAKELT